MSLLVLGAVLSALATPTEAQWGGGPPPGGKGFHGQPPPNYEGKEFYKVLGVNKDATDEQIKRQYRRLARQYHPDIVANKNEAAETSKTTKDTRKKTSGKKAGTKTTSKAPKNEEPKTTDEAREHFQQINEAYNVLSDPAKRKDYDLQKAQEAQYGKANGNFGGGFPGGFGAANGGKSSGLSEDQMRQAYEMFMRNFGSGSGGAGYGSKEPQYGSDDREEAERDAYYEHGGKGSTRNMYKDWQRYQNAKDDKKKKPTSPGGFGGVPPSGSQNPFGKADFKNVYDAYNMFTKGPSGGGAGGRRTVPEAPTSVFTSLFGDIGTETEKKSEYNEDPFAQYAESDASQTDKYSAYYKEYKKRKEAEKSPKGNDKQTPTTEPSAEDTEEAQFIKQFKAFEEYQKMMEQNERDRRTRAKTEEAIKKRQQTFNMNGMFGSAAERNAGDSTTYDNAHQDDEWVEDIFGNRKRKSKKKPTTTDPAEEIDPLEAAYSEEYQREKGAFDPQAAKSRKEQKIKDERKKAAQEGRSYVVEDDDDQYMKSFKSFGIDDKETGKNIPSTNTFEDIAKGWANLMAGKYASSGTVPEGASPQAGVDPKDAASDHLRKEEEERKRGVKKPRQQAKEKKSQKAKTSTGGDTKARPNTKPPSSSSSTSSDSKKQKKKKQPSSTGTTDYSKIPDLKQRPSDKEMEEWKEIFSDAPPDKNNFPKEPPPHDDPWWQTIFKDGKGPPPAGVKDEPRVPGKLNGPPPSSKKDKTKKNSSKTSQNQSASTTLEEDYGFSADAWEEHCGAEDSEHDQQHKNKACVIIFSSGTSLKALNDTFGAVARRFPLSSKTFFVTRTNATSVSNFVFERVREANSDPEQVPLVFKDALCGKSYEKATLSNAGEFCAIIVKGNGKHVQVVGKQRTAHLDLSDHLRSELDKNEAILKEIRKEKGLVANKLSIANGKDGEAMLFLPIKRKVIRYIEF